MVKVFDNVISEDLLNFIREEITTMRWQKQASSTKNNDEFYEESDFFACETHNAYLSHIYLFNFFCKKFSLNYKLIRSYVNCYPSGVSGTFHSDDGDFTFLFYPDKIQEKKGSTLFNDGTKIEYKTNRLLVFNAELLHKADTNLSNQMRHTIAWKTSI